MIKVEHSLHLLDAPVNVVNLVIEGDLAIRKAHTHVWPFLKGNEGVLWAIDDDPLAGLQGEVMGVQVWSHKQDGRVWWYEVSYILPEYRRMGIMSMFRTALRKLAAEDPCVKYLECHISATNEEMLNSIKSSDQKPANYHYRFPVKKEWSQ